MIKKLFDTWYEPLKGYLESPYFTAVASLVNKDRLKYKVIPEKGSELFFRAFRETPYKNLKVVILGQDPYPQPGIFDGLAFSNGNSLNPQPSLQNILTELETDLYDGFDLNILAHLDLTSWANQGVLLINTAHSVRELSPGSHLSFWKGFTDAVITTINQKDDIVWLLWGRHAQSYKKYIANPSHAVIETSHPSPLGWTKPSPIPFKGSKCFSKCNEELKARNLKEIDWYL